MPNRQTTLADPYAGIGTRATPQKAQADPRQVPNSDGGYVFTLDPKGRLLRFLILGADSPTYYASAQELTEESAQFVIDLARTDAKLLVDTIVEVSEAGRAPRQQSTMFALAIACKMPHRPAERRYAWEALAKVARTGTHLFLFLRYLQQFGGWGPLAVEHIRDWYDRKGLGHVGLTVTKYRQREGWTHRDVFAKAHMPQNASGDPDRAALYRWIHDGTLPAAGAEIVGRLPAVVDDFLAAQATTDVDDWVEVIGRGKVTWEMLPDAALGQGKVWDTLLDVGVPIGALIRQLPRITRIDDGAVIRRHRADIVRQLVDPEVLRKARVHPMNLLVAQRTYAQGHGEQSRNTWAPDRAVVDGLHDAFYAAYGAIEPTGKRILIALDCSASMHMSQIAKMPLTPREAGAALSLITLATEPDAEIVGWTDGTLNPPNSRGQYDWAPDGVVPLAITPRQRLDDVIEYTSRLHFGATNAALVYQWALQHGREFDAVVMLTDNEVNRGTMHPHQALTQYRQRTGLRTKQVIVGMTGTAFTIADPADPDSLDVVGFDSAAPGLIADFIR